MPTGLVELVVGARGLQAGLPALGCRGVPQPHRHVLAGGHQPIVAEPRHVVDDVRVPLEGEAPLLGPRVERAHDAGLAKAHERARGNNAAVRRPLAEAALIDELGFEPQIQDLRS